MKVFLVGAAYVSREAAKESKEVIMSTQPRCILLELDKVAHSLVHAAPHMMRHPPYLRQILES